MLPRKGKVMNMAVKKTGNLAVSEQKKGERKLSKQQLLAAKRFQGRKDIVNALLKPDKQYTVHTVEQMMDEYMKGKVK